MSKIVLPLIIIGAVFIGLNLRKNQLPTQDVSSGEPISTVNGVTASVDTVSLGAEMRTVGGTINGAKELCITLSKGDVNLSTKTMGVQGIPGYKTRMCNLSERTTNMTLKGNQWSINIKCPVIIEEGKYTIGVFTPGKWPDGRTNWGEGNLIMSEKITVSDLDNVVQCSTYSKSEKLSDGARFNISSRQSDKRTEMNFSVNKSASCDTIDKDTDSISYEINYNDGTKEKLRQGGVEFPYHGGDCSRTWYTSRAFKASNGYNITLSKNGAVIIDSMPIDVVVR